MFCYISPKVSEFDHLLIFRYFFRHLFLSQCRAPTKVRIISATAALSLKFNSSAIIPKNFTFHLLEPTDPSQDRCKSRISNVVVLEGMLTIILVVNFSYNLYFCFDLLDKFRRKDTSSTVVSGCMA